MRATTAVVAAGVGAVTAHAAPLLACVSPFGERYLPALSGRGAAGHVALTFDDGPDPASTPAFLDALDTLGWKATFFMLGAMVRRSPSLAAEVADAGHEVAVHGDQHRSHVWRTLLDVRADVARATDAVATASGRQPVWFRPPYGELATSSLLAARRQGLRTVLWTTCGRDWRPAATAASVAADIGRHLGPGPTVLLHDSDCTSAPGSWRSALESLPALADLFAARGLRPGPLAQHGLPVRA